MMRTSLPLRWRLLLGLTMALVLAAIAGGTAVILGFPEVIPGRAPSTLVVTAVLVDTSGATRPLAGTVVQVEAPPSPIPGTIRGRVYEQVTDATGAARFTLGNYTYRVIIPCAAGTVKDPCVYGTISLPDGRTVAMEHLVSMRAGTTVDLTLELGH